MKLGRCFKEVERIYGVHNGNQLSNNFKAEKTQEDIAEEFGLTVQTIHNYKQLSDMIPEMQDLIETGIVTPTTARAIIKQLPEFQQKELHKGSKAEVMEWIIDHQFARRNLTKSQIVLSREKVRKKYAEEGRERMLAGTKPNPTVNLPQGSDKKRNPTTDEKIAKKIGVSEKTYRNMRLITLEGTPEQIKRMDKGGKGNGVSAIAKESK